MTDGRDTTLANSVSSKARMKNLALFVLLLFCKTLYADWQQSTQHSSVWQNVQSSTFGAKGDGVTDDTVAIQAAINYNRPTNGWKGPAVIFVPPGTYKISNTIVVWAQTMLVGDENQPPQFLLVNNASGFNNTSAKKPVFVAADGYNINPTTDDWWDHGTPVDNVFNVWIHNINIQIGSGNAGAVGIFWKVAQVTSIRNVNITAGTTSSPAAIGIDVGGGQADYANGYVPQMGGGGVVENVTVIGGTIGIRVSSLSQWTLRNITTQNQSSTGVQVIAPWVLSLVNLTTSGAPIGLSYSNGNELAILDSNISGTSTAFSNDGSYWYAENTVGITSPNTAEANIVGWIPGWINGTKLSTGRQSLTMTRDRPMSTIAKPAIYLGSGTIGNAFTAGAKGDSVTDDTAALQNAINTYQTVYLPYGSYKINAPLQLQAGTRLIGEMPMTMIFLAPNSSGFGNANSPKSLIVTNGATLVCNLNVYANDSTNPGAQLVDWDGPNANAGIWDCQFWSNGAVLRDLCFFGPGVFSNVFCGGDATAAGILGCSDGPIWLYGVACESQPNMAFNISNAGDYYVVTPEVADSATALSITGCGYIWTYNLVGGSTVSNPLVQFSSDVNLNLVGIFLGGLSEICTTMPSNGSCAGYQGQGSSGSTQISTLQFH
jgi:hypothetical protein